MSHLHLIAIASPSSAPGDPRPDRPSLSDSVQTMTPPARSNITQSSVVSLQPSKNSSTTAAAKAASSVRYDTFFNNPMADAVVISSDRVIYRCFTWDLQRAWASRSSGQLGLASAIIGTFLELVTSRPDKRPGAVPVELSVDQLCSLLDLSAQYGFEKGVETCIASMGDQAKEDPWKVFELASKRDDVQLARMALRAMEHGAGERVKDFDSLRFEDFKDIAPAYHFELLRLLHIHLSTTIHTDPFTAAIIASPRPLRTQGTLASPSKLTPNRSSVLRHTAQTTPTRRPLLLRAPPSSMLPERQIVPRRAQGDVDWNQLAEDFDPWRK